MENEDATVDPFAVFRDELVEVRAELKRAVAEVKQAGELTRNLADHTAGLSSRVERGTFQQTRIANASEEASAALIGWAQRADAKLERMAIAIDGLSKGQAVLVDNVKDAEHAADNAAERAGEAARAADNSRSMLLPPHIAAREAVAVAAVAVGARDEDAPEREADAAPSDKSAAGYGFRAFALFVRAKGDTKAWLLALIALIGIFVLAYFSIVNKKHADELEHEGASMHGARK